VVDNGLGFIDVFEQRKTFVEEGRGGGHQREFGRGSESDSRFLGDEIFIDKVFGQSHERRKRKVTVREIVSCVCQQFSLKEEPRSLDIEHFSEGLGEAGADRYSIGATDEQNQRRVI